jgi:hypothetical protein
MPSLITLNEYRAYKGWEAGYIDKDPQVTALIPGASAAIINYTGRDFGSVLVTETRSYEYDGSGYLDIDDATAVTAVAVEIPHFPDSELTVDQWRAMPPRRDDSPVFTYLSLPGWGYGVSPEMGFLRNLDVYAREGRLGLNPSMVKVTGQWGWPTVPEDVKLAMFWTLDEWFGRTEGEGLAAEAIVDYSRSYQRGTQLMPEASAVPGRAKDILSHYARIYV